MAERKKNILVISCIFQPSAETGAKRFSFLSQIFHDKYFDVHILAPTENNYLQKDHSVSYSGTAHRVSMFPSYPFRTKGDSLIKKLAKHLWENYVCLVDSYSGWVLPSILKGLAVIKEQDIDAIIVSGPPFSPMITAYILSIFSGAKLILDYRDPWTNHRDIYPRLFGKQVNVFFERLVHKRASAFVLNTIVMKHNFIKDFGEGKKHRCHVLTNGFYPANSLLPLPLEKDKKVILYAGTFYGERRMGLLLEPLLQLIRQEEITKNDLSIHIFGKLGDNDKQEIEANKLGEVIKEHQFIEHNVLLRYVKGADILFLLSGTHTRYAIPAKFYDYLSVQRPILSIAPENSSVEQIMKEVDCGEFAVINDKESIKKCLRRMLKEEKKYTFSGSERYIWGEIAKKYAKIIYNVLET